jgi:hypothetical protein
MEQKRRCVIKRYYLQKICTNEENRREPLKQVIHSFQFHLA